MKMCNSDNHYYNSISLFQANKTQPLEFVFEFFIMKLLTWDGCFAVTLAPWESIKHLYLFRIAIKQLCDCQKEHSSVQQKINLQVPIRLSFHGIPLFLGKKMSTKCTDFATGCCFIHPALIFSTWNLIISLQHIKLCISLHSQSLWTLYITKCHKKSSINSESYFAKVVNKNLNS